jgi:hypothetical protein
MGNLPSTIYAGFLLMLFNLSEKYNQMMYKDYSDNSKKENLLDDHSHFKNADIENQNKIKENSSSLNTNNFTFFGKNATKKEDNTSNQYKLLKNSDENDHIEEKKENSNMLDNLKKEIKHSIIEFDMDEETNNNLNNFNDNEKKLIVKNEPEEMVEFSNHKITSIDENNKIENLTNLTNLKKPSDEKDKHLSFDDLRNEILQSDIEE